MIEQAARQAAEWRTRHPELLPLGISVNLSPRELVEPDFAAFVRETLDKHGATPFDLGFELTEHVFIDETDHRLVEGLEALRRLGARLSLDDFGTGYSSLATLKTFPFAVIKIDRFFIAAIREPTDSAPVTAATVGLAHSLGLLVVAEGVETPIQAASLARLGCDAGQGYQHGAPQSAKSTDALLGRAERRSLIVDRPA